MEHKQRRTLRQFANDTLTEINARIRDRVPYTGYAEPKTVVDVLHRVSAVDFLTNRRFKDIVRMVVLLSEGELGRRGALDLVSIVLGYSGYSEAQEAMVDLKYRNLRKELRKQRRESVVGITNG